MDLVTALAHEIKNPAAVALAHVNLLRLTERDNHHLDHIEAAITEICKLVHEMLTATNIRENPAETNLHKILADILETYRAAWPEINFDFDTPGDELPCRGNATSLRIIFSNLIKNAVEAIEMNEPGTPGTVQIVATGGDILTVTVTDTGEGSTQEKPHGNGLGLAICQNLAAGLGAHLYVSQPITGGREVTVQLPIALSPIGR